MKLTTRATIEIPRPPEAVFDVATDHGRLPGIMKKTGPIPGVVSIEPEAGAKRAVKMSDGSVMREEITASDRPHSYRYRWLNPPAAPFSLLVRSGESDWRFAAAGAGTRVEWTYTFGLTSPLAYPL